MIYKITGNTLYKLGDGLRALTNNPEAMFNYSSFKKTLSEYIIPCGESIASILNNPYSLVIFQPSNDRYKNFKENSLIQLIIPYDFFDSWNYPVIGGKTIMPIYSTNYEGHFWPAGIDGDKEGGYAQGDGVFINDQNGYPTYYIKTSPGISTSNNYPTDGELFNQDWVRYGIFVPEELVESYKSKWKLYEDIISPLPEKILENL